MFSFFLTLFRAALATLVHWLRASIRRRTKSGQRIRFRRIAGGSPATPIPHQRKKPDWIRDEIIRDAVRFASDGCRRLADLFNRRYAHEGWTVGKTFVSDLIRDQRYEIERRREWRRRRYVPGQPNVVWGMDATGKTDQQGAQHFILGIVDHGTRRCLTLQALKDKSSITVLRALLGTVERYGKPKAIRTDNEAIFRNPLFLCALDKLGTQPQRTAPHCPWQNGRIERLFGTLKSKLDLLKVFDRTALNRALRTFTFWYNVVRPHQHLQGRTPYEAWHGIDVYRRKIKRCIEYEAWGGLLRGERLSY